MKYLVLLVILIICSACSKHTESVSIQQNPKFDLLKVKYDQVKKIAEEKFDKETGWPSAKDCDGTLWAGIASAASLTSVRIDLAEWDNGEIHRRPKSSGECYPTESNSTVSRDMLLGYIFSAWRSGDRGRLERLARYGERHNWVMGSGGIGETLLTGNLIGLLGRSIEALGGDKKIYGVIPPVYSRDHTDYVMHLTALFILLNGEIFEKLPNKVMSPQVALNYPAEISTTEISKNEKEILNWLSTESPDDLLFKTAFTLYDSGNFDAVIDGLLKDDFYVPTYVRGNENYKYVHWLFTAKLILGRI